MSFRRKITRRQFIKGAAIAGGAMMMPALPPFMRQGHAFANSSLLNLEKFKDPMPLFGTGIPLATPFTTQPYTGVNYYKLTAGDYRQQLHSQLPVSGTRLYGYKSDPGSFAHLGGAVLATRGTPVRISFASALPAQHILPYDTSVPSPEPAGQRKDRAAIHLHGGLVPWASDGGPFHWQSNPANGGLATGASVIPWLWDGTYDAVGNPNKVWDYYYPNDQSARMMWYHDHAIAQTRLNAYAGIATGYILQDANDNATTAGGVLQNSYGIPFFGDPIVFQDKVFWDGITGPTGSDPTYPNYVSGAQPGDLWYPWFYDPLIWPIAKGGQPPAPSAIPEFFGDTMLANGHVFPFHQVGVGQYRFRFLNACNARWLDLSFVQENPNQKGEPLFGRNGRPVAANVDVWQIGTEGGFLLRPAKLVTGGVPVQPFYLGPGERADIIVDFKAPAANASNNIILYNVAGAPFPGGAPIFDWYPGNKNLPVQPAPGFGPNTRTIMQFRLTGNSPHTINMAAITTLPAVRIPTVPGPNGGNVVNTAALATTFPGFTYDPVPVDLSLNEVVEPAGFAQGVTNPGRLLTLLGNRAAPTLLPFGAYGTYYLEPPTETVTYNTIRIFRIFNFTVDAHPMHFHLVNVQILSRENANRNFGAIGRAVGPWPNEDGLKETVMALPGECLTLAVLVEDPLPFPAYPRVIDQATGKARPAVPVVVGATTENSMLPFSPRFQAAPYNIDVDEYVWHCHILEHEEHDMMRPLVAI